MKKKLLLRCLILSLPLSGCWGNKDLQQIDHSTRISQNWLSVEQEFADQLWKSNFLSDINDFFSLDRLNKTQKSDYSSDEKINIVFDKKSSIDWWIDLSIQKSAQWGDDISDIIFDIEADDKKTDPFQMSWEISLLNYSWASYLQIHDFNLFNGEWNMQAKMFYLMANELKNKWIDLEISKEWVKVNLMNIGWYLFDVSQFSENISDSSESLKWLQNILSLIDEYAKLWIDFQDLSLTSVKKISYAEDKNGVVWKSFEWSFGSKSTNFDVLIDSSQKWIHLYIYNINEFDEDVATFRQRELELDINLEENKKSDYSLSISLLRSKQKTLDLSWKIIFDGWVNIDADFVLEPLEIIAGQKISWKMYGEVKKADSINKEIPQLSWEILSISKISWVLF